MSASARSTADDPGTTVTRLVLAVVLAAATVLAIPVAYADDTPDLSAVQPPLCDLPVARTCEPLPELGWEGDYRSLRVELPSGRTGATLRGTLFAPPARGERPQASPVVVIVPGSGGELREEDYHWSARELAANGYVVLGVDPQGIGRSDTFAPGESCAPDHALENTEYPYPCKGVPFQQDEGFVDAHISGVDYALSDANPWLRLVDVDAVGLAGHSLGAGSAAIAQERDPRVRAIVAWDGLNSEQWSTNQNGIQHHVVAGHIPDGDSMAHELTPRVPALGLHSWHSTLKPYDTDPDIKSYAYRPWRDAGLPVMTLNLTEVSHGDFAQAVDTAPGSDHDRKLQRIQHYTRAWFDLHLREQRTASNALLTDELQGMSRKELFVEPYRSKAYLPSRGVECEDFRTCALPPPLPGRPWASIDGDT